MEDKKWYAALGLIVALMGVMVWYLTILQKELVKSMSFEPIANILNNQIKIVGAQTEAFKTQTEATKQQTETFKAQTEATKKQTEAIKKQTEAMEEGNFINFSE